MNKTLRLRRVPVAAGRPGRVLVATVFDDAERGMVRSAAAPLLAGALPGADLGGAPPVTAPGAAVGVMFAASYLDRRGVTAGFALVAHRDDAAGLALAEQAASRWLGALRSRRLLIADVAPLCGGGQRALRLMDEAASTAEPLFVLGTPVAPPGTERPGVVFGAGTDGVGTDGVPEGGRVFLPAHGAPLATKAEAAARGLRILDGTCPLVAAVQDDAAAYASRGDAVVVIGRKKDAVVPVLAAHAGEAAVVVHDTTEAEGLREPDPERVSFVIAPGMPADEAMGILAVLRRRFSTLRGHHFDVLCDAASDRALTIASVAGASELLLVVTGDANEPLAQDARAVAVTGLADLGLDLLAEVTTIGLVRTLSAPAGLDETVLRTLSGLGPLTVSRRGAYTTQIPEPVPVS
jgi:4-hydroxy-3-methylbut-2-enyl diphosphate reductase